MEDPRLLARDPPIRDPSWSTSMNCSRFHLDIDYFFCISLSRLESNLTADVNSTMNTPLDSQQIHLYAFLQGEVLLLAVSVM